MINGYKFLIKSEIKIAVNFRGMHFQRYPEIRRLDPEAEAKTEDTKLQEQLQKRKKTRSYTRHFN